MTKTLPSIVNKIEYKTISLYVMVLFFYMSFNSAITAQTCIGPYQHFESFYAKGIASSVGTMVYDGWVFGGGGASTVTNNPGNARSGSSYGVVSNGTYIQTPKILGNPSAFLCYVRGANATNTTYRIDWSTDPTFATVNGTTGSLTTGGTITYVPISVSATNNTSGNGQGLGSLTDLYFRITTSTPSAIYIDDMSWISNDTTKNTIIVPELGNTYCNTITLASAASIPSYQLYDNGGASDFYSGSQNHTLSIKPCAGSGKSVKLTLNSNFTLGAGDTFAVYTGTASGSTPSGPAMVSITGGGTLATPISYISCASDGSITVQFTSDATIPALGFSFTVECVDYTPPVIIATQPSTSTANYCVGGAATALTVAATGSITSPSYQWYSNSTNSNASGTIISGATFASYTPPTAIGNIGTTYYYCIVTDTICLSSETSAVSGGINVNALPSIIVVNSSGTYCVSTTLTASNALDSTIYWQGTTSNGTSTSTPSSSQLVAASGTYYFRGKSAAGCWSPQGSAVVTINNIPGTVTATAGTGATTTSIIANWTAVANTTGYYLDVSNTNTFATFEPGYNALSVGNVTTYTVTGLLPGVTYYYRIRASNSCGVSASNSVTITYATLAVSYCNSTSTSSTAYFTSFATLGGITNITNGTGYSASGYGDYTSTQTVTQVQGGSVSFTTSISGVSGGVGVSIFVDWNQNGVFTDAGERVFSTNGIFVFTNPSGSFNIPSSANVGTARMRIVVNYYSSTPVSCNTGITGETEDYSFEVTTLPCSGNPSLVSVVVVSSTAATISWTPPASAPANGYNYYLSTANTTPNSGTTPTGSTAAGVTTISLSGLTPSINYYFWVRSNCGGGLGQGVWFGVTSFLLPNCSVGDGSGVTTLGCPSVTPGGLGLSGAAAPPITDCTSGGCVDLEATYLTLGQTTSYTVQSIPYAPPYQFKCLRNPVNVSVDDIWSQPINLPFNFCFYGVNYNNCLIGSNGVLTFDTVNNTPGGFSQWSFASNIPSSSLFLNSIFGVYHDIDPSKGGQIGWELITLNSGCRALVASWSDIPMYSTSCNSILYTGMIVLYENTNVIEVYIKNKSVCSSWNGGNAIIGLQNGTGTQGVVPPNRNALSPDWTVTDEAWRFVPSGPSITSIKWYEGIGTTGALVGTTDVINVCPVGTTTYTAEVTYTLCNGTIFKETGTTTVTVFGSRVWNGSVDSDWNKPANWTPNNAIPTAVDCVVIPITANNPIISGTEYTGLAGTLTVKNGATLTINTNNNITVTDKIDVQSTGNFIIENNSNLVQVTNVATNNNTGKIIYKRNASIRKLDYVYWSSPVASFNVSSISSPIVSGPIYKWNTIVANNNNGWGNWESAVGSIMLAGKGYIVRGPDSFSSSVNSTLFGSFTGIPNNGIITNTIYRGPDQNTVFHAGTNGTEINNFSDNWNLLGNPYPSSISGSQFLFDNRTKIEGQIRLWTHGTLPAAIPSPFYETFLYNYTPGDYYDYNFTGTSCCPDAADDLFIGAGQGFFVPMLDGPSGLDTVTFNNDLRSSSYNNSLFYRQNSTPNNTIISLERNRIWLDIIDTNNKTDRTLLGYIEGATMDRDSFFDAGILPAGAMAIYSIIGNDKFVIQGRSLPFTPNDIVPIGVTIPQNGTYKIAIGAVDGLFLGNQTIYIEDKLLNVIQSLRTEPYIFTSTVGDITDRFLLRYTTEALGNSDFEIANQVIVSTNQSQIQITSQVENIAQVQVYDMLGREIFAMDKLDTLTYSISNIAKNQPLIIKIKLNNGSLISKKIIVK